MVKPNFFCGIEGLQWLLQNEPTSKQDDIDLTVDLIEAPYLFIYTSDADAWNLKVMGRGEIYDHEKGSGIERGNIRMDKKTSQGSGHASDPLLRDNMGAFFEACRRLSRYIRDENMQSLYAGLDPEQAGVMLEVSGGKLTARKVAGKERPEMMCTTLFGGTTMCRPYMEDFWDRSEADMMSLEEKIEKAEGGDKFAMAKLAQAYLDGDDEVEQDPAKAAYWFRKEAELEDSEGAFNLGLLYAKGFGVARDFEQAAEWMEKAVTWGDPDGKGPAALYRSIAENQRKAEAGDAAAMAALAEGYMGLGGSLDQAGSGEDYKLCLQWAQKAVDAGCAAGYWPLALAYEHGRGVEHDDAKAVDLYRKGAGGGNAPCQHSYGCRLMNGEGVAKNEKQAMALFEKSADQGYALANRSLGYLYEQGEVVEPDFDKELFYFERACQDRPNDAELLRHVGYQYTNLMDYKDKWLYGVEKAAYWLRKAADLGDRVATAGADEFEQILALHKEGKIPLGASMSDCMGYLSGEQPKQKDKKPSRPAPAKTVDAEQQQRQREQAEKERREKEAREKAERERKAREEAEAARQKAERDAKTIHETIRRARSDARSAESSFDRAASEIERATSGTLNYYSYDFQSRLRSIVNMSVDACQTLFNAYQNLVRRVDRTCRPLVNASRRRSEIQEIVDVIKWLNEESKIKNNFTGSLNGVDLGSSVQHAYYPDSDCVAIQRFWEDTLKKTPKTPEEIKEEQEEKERRQRAEAQRRAQEAEERRRKEEAARKEEQKRKEQQAAYDKALAEWNGKKAEVERKRSAEVQDRLEQFKRTQKDQIEKVYVSQKSVAKAKLTEAQKQEQEAQVALSALGFFRLSEKSELKKRIKEAQTQAAEATAAMTSADQTHRDAYAVLSDRVEQEKDRLTKVIASKYPLPKEPSKRYYMPWLQETTRTGSSVRSSNSASSSVSSGITPDDILAWMVPGVTYSIPDIYNGLFSDAAKEVSSTKIGPLMNVLISRGVVVKSVVKGHYFYTLA